MPKSERQVDHGLELWRRTMARTRLESRAEDMLKDDYGRPLPETEVDRVKLTRDYIETQERLAEVKAEEAQLQKEHAQIEEEDMTDRERWNRGVSQAAEEAP